MSIKHRLRVKHKHKQRKSCINGSLESKILSKCLSTVPREANYSSSSSKPLLYLRGKEYDRKESRRRKEENTTQRKGGVMEYK